MPTDYWTKKLWRDYSNVTEPKVASNMVEMSQDELTLFVTEMNEKIAGLEEGLLQLEQEANPALVAELFRHAHTIKGSAGVAGLTTISQLAHAMENLLDQVRSGTRIVDSGLIDALLEGVDMLRAMLLAVQQDMPSPDPSELIQRLSVIADQPSKPTAEPEEREPEAASSAPTSTSEGLTGQPTVLNLFIKPECPLPAARAFQAYLTIGRYAEVVSIDPSVDEILAGRAKYRVVAQVRFPDENALAELERELSRFDDLIVEVQRQKDGQKVSEVVSVSQQQEEPSAAAAIAQEIQSVKVSIEQLDALLNLVGELVIERARLERGVQRLAELNSNGVTSELQGVTERVSRIVGQLQESLTRTRMVPLSIVFGRFPRLVRELSRKMGKRIQLHISGEDIEIDRALVEKLHECLVHLVRNAIDHGIEATEERLAAGKPPEGRVEIAASQSEGSVIVVVKDDGRGIDPNKIRQKAVERGILTEEQAANASDDEVIKFIFHSGFSTKESVSEVSGRGVGMDVVKSAMEQIGGTVDLHSQAGIGTTVTLRLPLTLAIIPALLVRVGGRLFALPMHYVTEVIDLNHADVQQVASGERVLLLRGNPLPLWSLAKLLELPANGKETTVVIVRHQERLIALTTEGVEGKDEIVIKPLGYPLHSLRSFIGATILGDGSIALIVDLNGLTFRR